jgi:hypothetical protein
LFDGAQADPTVVGSESCPTDRSGCLRRTGVGDFNGDGLKDIVARAAVNGQWYAGLFYQHQLHHSVLDHLVGVMGALLFTGLKK